MTRKNYEGEAFDVSFDPVLCTHAAECVRGMSSVFDTTRRPWIELSQVIESPDADQLREVVARCPSGALRTEDRRP